LSIEYPCVVLVNPPITQDQRDGYLGPVIKSLYFNSPPLGIAYIAGMLERENVPVHLIDAAVEELTVAETVARIRASGAAIVGMTSTSNFFMNAVELAKQVKQDLPEVITVLGGSHMTSNAESAMQQDVFDIGCVGEGEITALELIRTIASGGDLEHVKGIVFRRDGELVFAEPRPLVQDLDELPMPARHLLPLDKYVPQPNDGPYLPKAAVISSRGCPYPCIFCDHGTFGTRYRSFSAKRIVDEMEDLVNNHGVKDIAFVDSLFMISRERVSGIIDEIHRRGIKVHWTCTIRANIADEAILRQMKEAGCWRVRIGVEAGDEDILKLIRKEVSLEQVRRVVAVADRLNLHPKGFFMVGHIGESRESIMKSIRLAKSLALTDITVQINTPLRGAAQWDMYADYGELVTNDLEDFSFWEPVFVPNGMTGAELEMLHRKFYRSFYFRPIIIWRHLRMLKKVSDLKRYTRAISLLIGMFVCDRRKRIGGHDS
jgi:anaerobic magnesium-protoporphyrin IX monomethyl ester cyclase